MKRAIFWIRNNHTWFFSGLGVWLLGLLCAAVGSIVALSRCTRDSAVYQTTKSGAADAEEKVKGTAGQSAVYQTPKSDATVTVEKVKRPEEPAYESTPTPAKVYDDEIWGTRRRLVPVGSVTTSELRLVEPRQPTSLTILPHCSKDTLPAILDNLRKKHGVRPITAFESNLPVKEIPFGTYFFLETDDLRTNLWSERAVQYRVIAKRFGDNRDACEMHYIQGQSVLVCFLGESDASRIGKLDGKSEKVVRGFPEFNLGADSLICIPISRINTVTQRTLEMDDRQRVSLLEIAVR
jgi:hypothetical protein